MAKKDSKKGAKILTLVLMMLSLTTIYYLPYLQYYYYTPLQEAMGLVGQDAKLGSLLNIYGIANVILYLPGGWIADKFDAKKLLVFSMVGTGALGLWEATMPSYGLLVVIYILFAITTVLTYWSSSIKCINMVSDPDEQSGMFGSLESGRGIVGLLVTTLFVGIFSATASVKGVIIACSILMIVVGVLLWFLMPSTSTAESVNTSFGQSMKAMGAAFKMPVTYLLAGLIFTASMTKASTSYFAPYLESVCGMDVKITTLFANYNATVCGVIGAAIGAVLATKVGRSTKVMLWGGIVLLASYVVMLMLPASAAVVWPLLIMMVFATLALTVFRALYYVTIEEAGTPKNTVGSVIGIASLLGFLPDTFYATLCGTWIETKGTAGYKTIFVSCILASVLGIVCSIIGDRMIAKKQAYK